MQATSKHSGYQRVWQRCCVQTWGHTALLLHANNRVACSTATVSAWCRLALQSLCGIRWLPGAAVFVGNVGAVDVMAPLQKTFVLLKYDMPPLLLQTLMSDAADVDAADTHVRATTALANVDLRRSKC